MAHMHLYIIIYTKAMHAAQVPVQQVCKGSTPNWQSEGKETVNINVSCRIKYSERIAYCDEGVRGSMLKMEDYYDNSSKDALEATAVEGLTTGAWLYLMIED